MFKTVQIGYTQKPHGWNGGIRLKVEEQYEEDLELAKVLFIEVNGAQLPYFIEEIEYANQIIIQLEDVNSKEVASKLSNKPIFLKEEEMLPEEEKIPIEDELQFGFVRNFMMIEEERGVLGEIINIEVYPQQEIATVSCNEKDVLIPLNEYLVTAIDEDKKEVIVKLPDGLVDL